MAKTKKKRAGGTNAPANLPQPGQKMGKPPKLAPPKPQPAPKAPPVKVTKVTKTTQTTTQQAPTAAAAAPKSTRRASGPKPAPKVAPAAAKPARVIAVKAAATQQGPVPWYKNWRVWTMVAGVIVIASLVTWAGCKYIPSATKVAGAPTNALNAPTPTQTVEATPTPLIRASGVPPIEVEPLIRGERRQAVPTPAPTTFVTIVTNVVGSMAGGTNLPVGATYNNNGGQQTIVNNYGTIKRLEVNYGSGQTSGSGQPSAAAKAPPAPEWPNADGPTHIGDIFKDPCPDGDTCVTRKVTETLSPGEDHVFRYPQTRYSTTVTSDNDAGVKAAFNVGTEADPRYVLARNWVKADGKAISIRIKNVSGSPIKLTFLLQLVEQGGAR